MVITNSTGPWKYVRYNPWTIICSKVTTWDLKIGFKFVLNSRKVLITVIVVTEFDWTLGSCHFRQEWDGITDLKDLVISIVSYLEMVLLCGLKLLIKLINEKKIVLLYWFLYDETPVYNIKFSWHFYCEGLKFILMCNICQWQILTKA